MTRAMLFFVSAMSLAIASDAPPRARFERIATLSWVLTSQSEQSWSPDGNWLALTDGKRLAVFDVRRPETPPSVLIEPPGTSSYSVAWSPDSRWIACGSSSQAFRPDSQSIRFSETLWVVSAERGSPIVLEPNSEARPVRWASDGFIYVWENEHVRHLTPPPQVMLGPDRIAIEPPTPFRYRDVLRRVREWYPMGAIRLPRKSGSGLAAPYPDHARFVMERNAARYDVVDTTGSVVSGFGGPTRWDSAGTDLGVFFANSVTSDGRYLAGALMENDPEATGHEGGVRSRAFLVSLAGWARIPLESAPRCSRMSCAPRGGHVALEVDLSDSLRVEVGVLRVER